MLFSDLITTLLKQSAFVDASDAEMALTTTLETLGFVLPARLVRELEETLPEPCGWPLAFGRSVREHQDRVGQGAKPGDLPGYTLERVQEVCAVLGRVLPSALVTDVSRELPVHLRGAFESRQVTRLPASTRTADAIDMA